MSVILDQINSAGYGFIEFAIPMLVQSSLLILILLLVDLLLRKKVRAGLRYWVWTLVLVKLVLPTSLSTPVSLGRWFGEELAVVDVDQMIMIHSATEIALDRHLPFATPMKPGIRSSSSASKPAISPAASMTRFTWQGIMFLAWLTVVVVMGLLLLHRTLFVRGLVAQAEKVDDSMNDALARCCDSMGIRKKVELRISTKTMSPAVCRLFRPVILLPQNLVLDLNTSQLRVVLMHELAHLKRFDLWVNFAQTFLQIVYFYNPLFWLANAIIRRAREQAVDEAVLVAMGENAQEYLETLISVAKLAFRGPMLSLRLIGVVESKSLFEWRIRTMLSKPIPKSAKLGVVGTVVLAVMAAIFLPMARAQRSEPGSRPTTEHNAETVLAAAPIPIQPPTFRKIWNLRGYDAPLSPDGKSIALAPVGTGKLCIIPRDGTVRPDDPNISQFFVNTAEIGVDPHGLAWSGNGRWIAFNDGLVHTGKREGNTRMYVVSAQGGKPKEVYDAYLSGAIHLPWKSLSPDGKTLAFSAQDANELHVYTISVEEGTPKRLVEVPARNPVFSPDGRMIAYVEDKNAGNCGGALWVVPAGGGTPRRVADAKNAWSPVWSPDGRMIAFFDFEGDRKICIIPVNERGEPAGEKITIDNPKGAGLLWRLTGWTPDNKIGMICQNPATLGLYTLSPNGGPATLVTHTGTEDIRQPRWSPDRKRIIYMKWPCERSNWLGDEGLASIAAEGGEATTIPVESDTKIWIATWGGGGSVSPDGKTIVFAGCKAQEAAAATTMYLWTLPIEGGRATQLTNAAPPLTDRYPCWSPDGKAIAFVRSRSSQYMLKMWMEADIYIIPSTGGEPRQLSSESDRVFFSSIAWSPDGKLLAYQSSDKEHALRVIPATGGESRLVAKLRRCESPGLRELAWSPDSRRIALSDGGIQIISLDDGRVTDIDPGLTATKLYHLDWSRDGARLVFAGWEGGGNGFWLVENFLPAANSVKASK